MSVTVFLSGASFSVSRAPSHDPAGSYSRGTPRVDNNSNLIDNGGPVLPASHIYVLWWGNSSAWPGDAQPGIDTFFSGLNGSAYVKTAGQYMRGATITVSFVNSSKYVKSDPTTPPYDLIPVFTGAFVHEIKKEFRHLDPLGIYFVFTSNFPPQNSFCAFHGVVQPGRAKQFYYAAYIPNPINVSGCDPGNPFNLSGSDVLRALAVLAAHEFTEAITDPQIGSAWVDDTGVLGEVADKCEGLYSASVTLANSSVWQLPELWSNDLNGSNHLGGCTQTTP